jgi:hypothetical protein
MKTPIFYALFTKKPSALFEGGNGNCLYQCLSIGLSQQTLMRGVMFSTCLFMAIINLELSFGILLLSTPPLVDEFPE